MKKFFVVAVAVAMIAMAGTAMAVDTATVNVSAIVPATCRFSNPAATLAFGALPTPAAPVTTSTTLDFWCTNGAAYTITDDDGLFETGVDANRMRSTTLAIPEFMPYTLTYIPASGTGLGPASPITLTFTGNILAASYASLSGDIYQDTVTLTITP